MNRGLLLLDRVVLLLLGVALIAASAFLVVWGLGRWPGAPAELDLAAVRGLPEQDWWPWALGVGGALALLAGLRSLVAHARRRRVRRIALPGPADRGESGETADTVDGRLRLDLAAVAQAAAEVLARSAQVQDARGHLVPEQDVTVLELVARVDASSDLSALRAAVDRTRDELAVVLPSDCVMFRVRLDVRRARVENARVA